MTVYKMVQECVDSYDVQDNGTSTDIHIRVPKRFADLWLTKLSELETDDREIADYEPPEPHLRLT